ncbi:MAG TPA: ATP-binding protein [Bryobacteraceae bacterium]|nr:ATP-binding protein [Bryobacteraceae bacterium]
MMNTLTIDGVIELVAKTPEQALFDWKRDFVVPVDDEKKGELIKDLAAVANACASSYGYILYGVSPGSPDPIVGTTQTYDDAKLQQLANGKIEPLPEFLYYEVSTGPKVVGVLQVKPTRRRPHIIRVDLGKIRKGQIPIRRGSSTDGITIADLFEFFYGQTSGYFPGVVERLHVPSRNMEAQAAYLRELRSGRQQAERDMEMITGVKLR